MSKSETLSELLAPIIEAMQYEFVGVEFFPQGQHSLLRIYIDKENGVNVDDCALVSRQVSRFLDVEDPIPSEYILEVSSPGVDRPLFTIAQFEQFIGHTVKVRLRQALNKKRKFIGIIQSIEGDNITLKMEDNIAVLTFQNIEKARLQAQW